jgi:ABC-type transport system substrate-binding protein
VKVRQALNYAIDKESILDTILKGRGVPSHGPIPPSLPGYNEEINPYPYNPAKAKELLRLAGLGEGFEMTIYQRESKEAQNLTEVFQAQLSQVGIRAKIVQREWSAFKEAINKGEPDSFYLAWVADYPDSENFLAPLFHSKNFGPGGNRARFKDEEVDRLIEEAQATINYDRRLELYQRLEMEIHERAPWVFLWHLKEYVVHQPWVKNLRLYPIYNGDKGIDVELSWK